MTKEKLTATLQHSYYGKAIVIRHDNGEIELQSYNTIVCGYYLTENGDLEFRKLWNGYSNTTAKHINDFRLMMGDPVINKKFWDSLPCDGDEAFRVGIYNGFSDYHSRTYLTEDEISEYNETLMSRSCGRLSAYAM